MKNLIIIIGTIILGTLIVNQFILSENQGSLWSASKKIVTDGTQRIESVYDGSLNFQGGAGGTI